MAAAESAVVASRVKREDRKRIKHGCLFSKFKVLIGSDDWEDCSEGKEGVSRYRVENLPKRSTSGIYEIAIHPPGKLDPDKLLVVYVGKADSVRTRLQDYGRNGSHWCRSSSGEKGCELLEYIFSRGCSILYRWAPMEKAEASIKEAQLLDTFDYAWNKDSNGPRRHDDILQKLRKGAPNGGPTSNFLQNASGLRSKTKVRNKIKATKLLSQDDEFSKNAYGEIFDLLLQVFKFGRSQPRLVLDRGGSNENETITCGEVLGDGPICRKIPGIATVPSLIAGNCPAIEHSGPVCGVAMDDDSICRRQPISGRERCNVHEGMKTCNSNLRTRSYQTVPYAYSIDASGFDKNSEILIPGKVEIAVAPYRPVNEGCNTTCGVELRNGYFCTKQPVRGRVRCEEHEGLRVTSLLSGSYSADASGFDKNSEILIPGKVETGVAPYRPVNEGCNTICGVELGNGYFCTKQTVRGRVRCEEHKGLRVTSLLSGSDSEGTSHVSESDSRFNSYNRNHSSTSVSMCGAPTLNGSSCQRTVNGNRRCWQHLNYDSGSSSNYLSTRYSDYGGLSSVSMCGAPTLNGSSCQRTVNGNGRCWQHSTYDSGSGSSSNYFSTRYLDYGGSSASICGAPTRNGSYCQRTVRGNGRCWQH